jgi:hypothetical protein
MVRNFMQCNFMQCAGIEAGNKHQSNWSLAVRGLVSPGSRSSTER